MAGATVPITVRNGSRLAPAPTPPSRNSTRLNQAAATTRPTACITSRTDESDWRGEGLVDWPQKEGSPVSFEFILTQADGPVGIVTINRPQVRNALNHKTIAEIVQALEAFDRDPAIRCLILTGNDRAFAAGADVTEMAGAGAIEVLNDDNFSRWARIQALTKPRIAAGNGDGFGGGGQAGRS